MENRIRGAVLTRFHTISAFAEAVGWKRGKACRIVNGIQPPSVSDIEEMAECLNITDAGTFLNVFFPQMFTM